MGVEFVDRSDEVLSELKSKIPLALEAIGMTAEGYAKKRCPVDTGVLRNSISHSHDDDTAYIGTNVEYAAYVEFGTVNTRAQPYLKPAATEHSDEYRRMVENVLKK